MKSINKNQTQVLCWGDNGICPIEPQNKISNNQYRLLPPLASIQDIYASRGQKDEQRMLEKCSATLPHALARAPATSCMLREDDRLYAGAHPKHAQWALCPVNLLATATCQSVLAKVLLG